MLSAPMIKENGNVLYGSGYRCSQKDVGGGGGGRRARGGDAVPTQEIRNPRKRTAFAGRLVDRTGSEGRGNGIHGAVLETNMGAVGRAGLSFGTGAGTVEPGSEGTEIGFPGCGTTVAAI